MRLPGRQARRLTRLLDVAERARSRCSRRRRTTAAWGELVALRAGSRADRRGQHRGWDGGGGARAHALHDDRPGRSRRVLERSLTALYYGPTPVPEAIARCEELLADEAADRFGEANVERLPRGSLAQPETSIGPRSDRVGERDLRRARPASTAAPARAATVLGDVELLAGEQAAAEPLLRGLCEAAGATRMPIAISRAGRGISPRRCTARVGSTRRPRWTRHRRDEHRRRDDLEAQVSWMPVRAKILARRAGARESGGSSVATLSACATERRPEPIVRRPACDLGEVLRAPVDRMDGPSSERATLELYERKGNAVGAAPGRAHAAAAWRGMSA